MSAHRVCTCCQEPGEVLKGTWCGTNPTSCEPFDPPPKYFHAAALCEGTEDPIEPGQVIFYKGLCYTLTDEFTPPDPMVVEPAMTLLCIGTGPCSDSRCGGPWYYQATPCQHGVSLTVLVEYCDAQAIFAAAHIPGERAVQCIVFKVGDYCWQLRPESPFGNVPDTTGVTVIGSIGTWYRNCCHCNSETERQPCASSESAVPAHYSGAAPECWTGDPQGGCCGHKYLVEWQYRSRVQLYADGTPPGGTSTRALARDDVIEHSGAFIIGPPGDCPSSPLKAMAVACQGQFRRVMLDGFPWGPPTEIIWEPSLCGQWADPSPEHLVLAPPIGCHRPVYIQRHGGCASFGGMSLPTSWAVHLAVPTGLRYLSVNGHDLSTDCEFEGVETNVAGGQTVQRIAARWKLKHGTGGGTFEYAHDLWSGSPLQLVERITIEATYKRTTVIPCGKCNIPSETGGDVAMAPPTEGIGDAIEDMMRRQFGRPCQGCG